MDIFQLIVIIAGASIVGALFYGAYVFAREEWADKDPKVDTKSAPAVPAE